MSLRKPSWIYFWLFFILFIQQSVVASSSIWIKKFTDSLETQQPDLTYISLFFVSLTLPYVIGVFCSLFTKRLEIGIFEWLVSKMADAFKNKPQMYTSDKIKSDTEGCITSESWALSRDTAGLAHDATSSSLNVVLNLSAISIFIEPAFAVYLAVGFIISCLVLKFSAANIVKSTEAAQAKKYALQNSLIRFWDNVTLGNTCHFDLWSTRNTTASVEWREAEIGKNLRQHLSSATASIASILPFAAYFIYSVSQGRFSNAQLIVHAAVLYRMFQIINSASFLYAISAEASSLFSRVTIVKSVLTPQFSAKETTLRIKPEELSYVEFDSGSTWQIGNSEDFVAAMALKTRGRFALSGKNGSGKSTILLLLKEQAGGSFLPASHRLESTNLHDAQKSTGQKQASQIKFLLENSSGPLFLDEWAANIDLDSRQLISELLNTAAKTRLVIEVNHSV